MTLLQYYLYANIYVVVFWICYRICLKNLLYYTSVRIYLNSSIVLSSILPLIQIGVANLIGSSSMLAAGQDLPWIGILYEYQLGETLSNTSSHTANWPGILRTIVILGSVATALIYVFNHLRIISIVKRSTEYLRLDSGLQATRSDEVSIPFIYINRIVIPGNISDEEITQVVAHEILHYRNAHHFDNMLFSLLHMVFWANPFFLLLRNALKLNHEFQVDNQILSSGVDPVSYKLSLVKYSIGSKLFSLANGLSSSNTKNRLQMINNNQIKKGKWRLFLLAPIIGILFTIFCFAYIQPDPPTLPTEMRTNISQEDTLVVEFINPYAGLKAGEEVIVWKSNAIIVLMNSRSEIMIAREELSLENAEKKIISEYNSRLAHFIENSASDSPEFQDPEIKIAVSKDRKADVSEYKKLVDAISNALLKLREWHSVKLYDGTYTSLSVTEQEAIAKLIPLRIYGTHPDNLGIHPDNLNE
jgi:hypothetical protein